MEIYKIHAVSVRTYQTHNVLIPKERDVVTWINALIKREGLVNIEVQHYIEVPEKITLQWQGVAYYIEPEENSITKIVINPKTVWNPSNVVPKIKK